MAHFAASNRKLSASNLGVLVASASISEFGNWVTFIALNTLIWQHTGSALAISGLFIAQTLPVLMCGVPAGMLADRANRKRLMITADVVRGSLIFGLAMLVPRVPGVTLQLSYAYCAVALVSATSVLFQVTRTSSIPTLVEGGLLLRTNSLMSLSADGMSILGPGLAGAAVRFLGPKYGLMINGVTFFLSAILLCGLRATADKRGGGSSSLARIHLSDALRFLKENAVPRLVIASLVILMVTGGAVNALFVVYAQDGLGLDSLGYGTLLSSLGVGFVTGSLLMTAVGPRIRPERLFLVGIVIAALAPISWALSAGLSAAVLVSVLNGAANSMFGIAGDTILQCSVPDRVRGRVLSVGMTAQSVSALISMGLAGVLSNALGVHGGVIVQGGNPWFSPQPAKGDRFTAR